MFIVGLTGGIATGKSTVSEIFKSNGVIVVDADVIARKVVEPGRKAWHKIMKEFGEEVFHPNGELNREALGNLIFNDRDKRFKLNQITHPEIYKEMLYAATKCFFRGEQFIVMDLPLLFENEKMLSYMHKTIVVHCEKDDQLSRLMARGEGMSRPAALSRIDAQMPLEQKCERANIVVFNSGTMEDTRKQVEGIISMLRQSRAHWKLRLFFIGLVATVFYVLKLLIWS